MAGQSCKWLEMARTGWNWLEKTGNGQNWLAMAGMAGNGWQWLEIMIQMLQKQLGWPYGASSEKNDFVAQAQGILNLKGYQNCITFSEATAILLNG